MLTLERVAQRYGDNLVFKNVSCTLEAGSVTLLVGDNGAGKSTLLRIMAGLTRPVAGTARFAEPTLKIGYLGHATFVYPALTAFENLLFWRDSHGLEQTEEDIFNVLERTALAGRARDRAGTFSRGMAQRLNLARVILQQPDIFLLDEPTTGLDAKSRAMLHKEILLAREQGACVVLVSHDLAQAEPLADRVFCLEKRTLVEKACSRRKQTPERPCCA
ncbi:MAG: heme ABC exporter ATP-binding protein CcmA [Desulfovibrio sp.]|jgi:heme exporter protein A|nr:heme ABC exporter ATP-binding protein CcmA [Desulfovibrio sp.]